MSAALALLTDDYIANRAWLRLFQQGGHTEPPLLCANKDELIEVERLVVVSQSPLAKIFEFFAKHELAAVIEQRLQNNQPTLLVGTAIHACLAGSEEQGWIGFDLLPGQLHPFTLCTDDFGSLAKAPHIGWNGLVSMPPHPLWAGIHSDTAMYFSQQYYVADVPWQYCLAHTQHGIYFPSAFYRDSLCAVQFQPQISGPAGAQFMENFLRWRP